MLKTIDYKTQGTCSKRIMVVLDDDIINDLEYIGRRRGCLVKGGEVDLDKVITLIINDVKLGNIKGITFDRY